MKRAFVLVGVSAALAVSPAIASETIGPWEIVEAPDSASLIAGGGWGWLNVVDEPVTVEEAFTGFGMVDDGFANADEGTTVEVGFSGGVMNVAGPDVVLFDAHFDFGQYTISSDFDGFVLELGVSDWIDSGVDRVYYFEHNSGEFPADVWGAAIDLSDLDVPMGQSVNAFRFTTTDHTSDPLGLGVIPAPGVAPILLVGFVATRRRRT